MPGRKSIDEINHRIERGEVCVVTAEEMVEIVEDIGPERAAKEVDVVTCATFGPMCSSGVFLNFGHSDPPIKMRRVWLNGVEAYTGIAAVDAYLGATQPSEDRGIKYGGAHVIHELASGEEVVLRAEGFVTDCYPRESVETLITIDDINQAVIVNPRNSYQRYVAATNSSEETLYTYMGKLLPEYGNVTYCGAGQLNPLANDPEFRTIGIGTRIWLAGSHGYIIGEGTQHDPSSGMATLMVKGDLKEADPKYLRPVVLEKYGVSLAVGIGVPIPVLNERVAASTGVSDADIEVPIVDYGVPSRDRPVVKRVTYEELRSGRVEIEGKTVRTGALSSYKTALEIAERLKEEIEEGEFTLTRPAEPPPRESDFKPMPYRPPSLPRVENIMTEDVVTASPDESIEDVARKLIEKEINHIPVVDEDGRIVGIVTSWDIAAAVAEGKKRLKDIMTEDVITIELHESVDEALKRMDEHNISCLPVVDKGDRVVGIVTRTDITEALRRRGQTPSNGSSRTTSSTIGTSHDEGLRLPGEPSKKRHDSGNV
ncbi:homocysteine biosynthesis protein [Methanopyrus sp.]